MQEGALLEGSLGRGVGDRQRGWGDGEPCGHLVGELFPQVKGAPVGFQQGAVNQGALERFSFLPDCCVGNKWGSGEPE